MKILLFGESTAYGACATRKAYRWSEIMAAHLQLVAAPRVRLSRLGHDTALMGAIAIAMHGLE